MTHSNTTPDSQRRTIDVKTEGEEIRRLIGIIQGTICIESGRKKLSSGQSDTFTSKGIVFTHIVHQWGKSDITWRNIVHIRPDPDNTNLTDEVIITWGADTPFCMIRQGHIITNYNQLLEYGIEHRDECEITEEDNAREIMILIAEALEEKRKQDKDQDHAIVLASLYKPDLATTLGFNK